MAGEILANVILKGDKKFRSSVDDMGDEMEESAGSAGVLSGALASLGGAATSVIVPSNHAANAIDEVGDESTETAPRVGILSGSFATLSATSNGLAFSLGLVTTSLTSVAGAIGLITLALAPLLPVVLTAAGAFGALAAIFGVIVGSGIVAWMDATGTKMKDIYKAVSNLVKSFGKQFIPLIKDAVALLPSFINKISDAVGSLDPFVHALRVLGSIAYKVIPPLIGVFVDLAKAVLPFVIDAAKWIGKRLVPALRALFDAGMRAAGEVFRLGKAFFDIAKSLAGVAGWVGRFATALYDLAAAALGVGNLTKELKRVGEVIRQGLQGAFNWLSTTGVKLAKKAFSAVADAAIAAFDFAKTELIPAIKTGLSMAWEWVRTKGVTHAKNALGFLADKALAAFEFTKNEIIPAISSGLGKAWQWVKTQGVSDAKAALDFLADKAVAALEFAKKEIVPKVKSGLKKAWTWIKTQGVTDAKNALKFLSKKASAGLKKFEKDILPKIKDVLRKVSQWIRTKGVKKLKKALKTLGKKAVAAFKFGKQELLPKVKKAFQGAVKWIQTKGVKAFKSAFRTLGRKLGPAIIAYFSTQLDIFKTIIPKMVDWIRQNGIGLIKDAFFAMGRILRLVILSPVFLLQAFKSLITGIWQWLTSGGTKMIKNAFVDIITGVVTYLKNDAWSDLLAAAEFLFDAMMAAAKGLYQGLIGGSLIPKMMNAIADFIKNFPLAKAFNVILSAAFDRVFKFGQDIFNSVKHALQDIIHEIQSWNIWGALDKALSQAWSRIHKFGTDALNTVKNFFGDIINYFQNEFLNDVKQALANAARQAVQTFKRVFNSKIPDKIPLPSVSIAGRTIGGGSIDLPELHSGGTVTQTGLFVLEAGETVVPGEADMPYNGGSGGGSQEVTVAIDVRGDSELARMIERHIDANEQQRGRAIDRSRSSFGGS